MSQQELDRTDRELIDMVNERASQQAKEDAERLAAALRQPTPEELAAQEAEDRKHEQAARERQLILEYQRERKIRRNLVVAACLLIALMLLIARYVPWFVGVVVNLGILICGIVAAIIIDRYTRAL